MGNIAIICKYCGVEKQIKKSQLHPSGNFCSQKCYRAFNFVPPEIRKKRRFETEKRWREQNPDKYQAILKRYQISEKGKEAQKRCYMKSEKYHLVCERKRVKEKVKKQEKENQIIQLIRQRAVKEAERTYTCLLCKKLFTDKYRKRKYCSHRCICLVNNTASNALRKIYSSPKERKKAAQKRSLERNRGNVGKRAGNGGIGAKAFWKMKIEYGFRCAICNKTEPFTNQYWPLLTQEHWNPRYNGGKRRSRVNIVPTCWKCNMEKGTKIPNTDKPLPVKLLCCPPLLIYPVF